MVTFPQGRDNELIRRKLINYLFLTVKFHLNVWMQTFSCEHFLLIQEINGYNYEEMDLIHKQYISPYRFWQKKLRKIFFYQHR